MVIRFKLNAFAMCGGWRWELGSWPLLGGANEYGTPKRRVVQPLNCAISMFFSRTPYSSLSINGNTFENSSFHGSASDLLFRPEYKSIVISTSSNQLRGRSFTVETPYSRTFKNPWCLVLRWKSIQWILLRYLIWVSTGQNH